PPIAIIRSLIDARATIRAFNPEGGVEMARRAISGIEYAEDTYNAAAEMDCLVLKTESNAFRFSDLSRLKSVMEKPIMVDLGNVYRRA
ncbi:MAG: UDP-glucose/GDP-mannose dehydrogenase family protein, partial [Candidatus Devosia symbiotica]|nr:UDP-glucose/GDP-mannose dehydrogenase family protein [Candidatus Devosia symbiotica]